MRRLWVVIAVTFLAAACATEDRRDPGPVSLEFVSDFNIPTGTPFASIGAGVAAGKKSLEALTLEERKASGDFGGISSIAYDAASARLYALSDSSKPVMFVFELTAASDRLSLSPLSTLRLHDSNGQPLAAWSMDPEGLAMDGAGGFLIASEGFPQRQPPVAPGVFRFDASGRLTGQVEIPSSYVPAGNEAGIRNNKGFESLTLSPSGRTLFVATEGPLADDSRACTTESGCEVRILEYELHQERFTFSREYVYRLDALSTPWWFFPSSGGYGLVELLALGEDRLLALERGFAVNRFGKRFHHARLQLVTLSGTSAALHTSPILDLADIVPQLDPAYRSLDNFEGMCFGATLTDGRRGIILVSDNNYSERQRTSFLLFRFSESAK